MHQLEIRRIGLNSSSAIYRQWWGQHSFQAPDPSYKEHELDRRSARSLPTPEMVGGWGMVSKNHRVKMS